MAKSLLLKKLCCLSLSGACILFGLLDLIITIFVLVSSSITYDSTNQSAEVIYIVMSTIGACTCLLMLTGSIKNHRWLMAPHVILNALLIIGFILGTLINIVLMLTNGLIIEVLWTTLFSSCTLALSILYWIIMLSRAVEIKEEQSAPETNEVEMERC